MRLRKVTVTGFRTFRKKQSIDLPSAPGLYLVRGSNEVDSSLEGNDVGKSTFWDAVYWCFYGVTTRGLKAGNIVSWGEKQASVKVEIEIGGVVYRILRQQNPNLICLDGVQANQETIDSLLGYNPTEFLHSVLIGQFSDFFMDLGATDKLGLFSDVLDLNYWGRRSDDAKSQASSVAAKCDAAVSEFDHLEGELSATIDQCKATKKSMDAWQIEQDEQLDNSRERVERLTEWCREIRSKLTTRKHRCTELRTLLDDLDAEQTRARNEQKHCSSESRRLLDLLNESTCPVCGSEMTKEVTRRLCRESKQYREKIETLKHGLSRWELERQQLVDSLDKACRRRDKLKHTLNEAIQELTAAKALCDMLDVVENPHSVAYRRLQERRKVLRSRLQRLDLKRSLLTAERDRYQYWVKGFRDLKLWVLNNTLAELEMLSNNSLIQLGLDRWLIHYAVDRETKSGSVSRGFHVTIESPGSDEHTPWKSWGGGVTQRLRLSSQTGLAQLIHNRKRHKAEFEVWDEPTAHLSPRGVTDLLTCLQARSQEEDRVIFVVDHRMLDFAFDGVLSVTKTLDGSILCDDY